MGYIDLSPDDWDRIEVHLVSIFDPNELARLVRTRLPSVHHRVLWQQPFRDIVHQLTDVANRTLASYLAALGKAQLKHLAAPDEEKPLRAVLGLSVDRLRETSARAAQQWHDLAVFPAPPLLTASRAGRRTEPILFFVQTSSRVFQIAQ